MDVSTQFMNHLEVSKVDRHRLTDLVNTIKVFEDSILNTTRSDKDFLIIFNDGSSIVSVDTEKVRFLEKLSMDDMAVVIHELIERNLVSTETIFKALKEKDVNEAKVVFVKILAMFREIYHKEGPI